MAVMDFQALMALKVPLVRPGRRAIPRMTEGTANPANGAVMDCKAVTGRLEQLGRPVQLAMPDSTGLMA